jgi:hypothetical protein
MHHAGSILSTSRQIRIASQQGIDQGAIRVPLPRMHNESWRFVDHRQVVIFVYHLQRDILCHELDLFGRRNSNQYLIPLLQAVACFDGDAIHCD